MYNQNPAHANSYGSPPPAYAPPTGAAGQQRAYEQYPGGQQQQYMGGPPHPNEQPPYNPNQPSYVEKSGPPGGPNPPYAPNQQGMPVGGPQQYGSTNQPYAPVTGAPASSYGQPGAYGPGGVPTSGSAPPATQPGMQPAGGPYSKSGVPSATTPGGPSGGRSASPGGGILGIGGSSKSKGLFGSLRKEWDSAVNTFDKYTHSGVAVAEYFNKGNVVQLISRNSGRTVQIVQAPNGMLTIDANGLEGPNTFNALWTVSTCYNYTVQIHNNFNYLAIENGVALLKHYAHPMVGGPETKLRIISVDGQFVYLECDYDEKFHMGFEQNGFLKSAIATGRDVSAQFAVRLIHGLPKKK